MDEDLTDLRRRFRRAEHFWVCEAHLGAFAGFRKTRTPRRSFVDGRSDGLVTLFVEPAPDNPPEVLTRSQDAALRFLLNHQDRLAAAITDVLFQRYPAIRQDYLEFTEDEDIEDVLPVITAPDQMKDLIGLTNVHILLDGIDTMSYTGFEFGCTWEVERGIGVMTLGDRIIAIGQAQTSFEPPAG